MHFGPEDDAGVSSLYPAPTAAPGASAEVEAMIATLMTLVDEHGAQRWTTGWHEHAHLKPGINLADKQAVAARAKIESALRTALLANAAGGQAMELLRSLYDASTADYPARQSREEKSDEEMIEAQNAWAENLHNAKEAAYEFLEGAPPPPVGEPQGVSDAEVQKALRDYGWFVTAENEANMRRALESFAASRPVAVGVSASPAIQAVVAAAQEWSSERAVSDWAEAELMKAVVTLDGDWPGCDECDHECDEPCMPATVAEQHLSIDRQIAQLVHEGKLPAHEGYAPPEGFKPYPPRRRTIPIVDATKAGGAS